ncbi:hypothetical protein CAEBREN_11763 [Caenorhabditis brenneri]|uniref:F-box domain-containing protein n=1 Tax=Caenorhabditis brenneri TaxID=135651 RepID=G0N6A1_CAEBE|nr:hypothetical protein CAEBREN_11763 [Caenorhabditis brenneri]
MPPEFLVDYELTTRYGGPYHNKDRYFKFGKHSIELKAKKDPNRVYTCAFDEYINSRNDIKKYYFRDFKNETLEFAPNETSIKINCEDEDVIIIKFQPESVQFIEWVVQTYNKMLVSLNERIDHALRNTHPRILPHMRKAITESEDPFGVYQRFLKDVCYCIDYPEFEMWFYRISNGQLGESYDRSDYLRLIIDPPREMKSILDMPTTVFDKVLDKLKFTDHLTLRKVSTQFRTFLDSKPPQCKSITVEFGHMTNRINFNVKKYEYSNDIDYEETFRENTCKVGYKSRSKTIEGANFYEQTILDLIGILKMPKLQLEKLKIIVKYSDYQGDKWNWSQKIDEIFPRFIELMERNFPKTQKVHVKTLSMKLRTQNEILSILPYLTPGVLEEIKLSSTKLTTYCEHPKQLPIEMDEVVELEQWKKAKFLRMEELKPVFVDIDEFTHFESFFIDFQAIGMKSMLRLRDVGFVQANTRLLCVSTATIGSSAVD